MGWKGHKLKGKKTQKKHGEGGEVAVGRVKKQNRNSARFRTFFLNNLEEVQRWT